MNIIYFCLIGYLGFTVGPAKVEKALIGTETITEVFEIQNFTSDSLRIVVEFEDFDIDKLGEVTFYPGGYFANSLAPRAVVNPEEFVVRPKDVENVRVTFRLDRSSGIPEYYGMMLFKSRPIPTRYASSIAVAGEVGVPVYYAIPEHTVRDASFDSLVVVNDTLEIVLHNTGNVHLRAKGEALIRTFDDKLVQRDSLPEIVIMPRKQRKLKIGLKKPLDSGSYAAEVIFDYGAIELLMGERRFRK
jgi:hypothetical protein